MIKINSAYAKKHLEIRKFALSNFLLVSNVRYICEVLNNTLDMKIRERILKNVAAALMVSVILILASCEKVVYNVGIVDDGGNGVDTVHFQTQVQPIFTANCITCHHGSRNPDLRDGYSYASLTSGGFVNRPAESSRLYVQLTSSSHTALTVPAEKQTIYNWIQQGALNN